MVMCCESKHFTEFQLLFYYLLQYRYVHISRVIRISPNNDGIALYIGVTGSGQLQCCELGQVAVRCSR